MAWFTESGASDQGYWAAKLLPSQAAKVKAPGSGGTGLANNQPFQSVAFAARAGGGEYLAYCVPNKTIECAHIALWKVGASKASTVPWLGQPARGSRGDRRGSGRAHVGAVVRHQPEQDPRVRTNAAVTRFGPAQTIPAPPNTGELDGLQAEGSQGPLDVVALVLQNSGQSTPSYWDTQLLPKLSLTGSPSSVSHKKATTVTFTATDVGDPVPGATVSFLGRPRRRTARASPRSPSPRGPQRAAHRHRGQDRTTPPQPSR